MGKAKITRAPAASHASRGLRAALIGTMAALLLPAPGGAQDEGAAGGFNMTLGLSQRFESDDNSGLNPVSAGTTLSSTTQLSFGLASDTRDQSLSLDLSTALRIVDGPETSGSDVLVDDPRLVLIYSRQAANSAFAFDANYRQSDIAFFRPLDEFLNEDGELVLPDDLSDLSGTGTRTEYGANTSVDLGTQAPFGVNLTAGLSGVDYADVSNAELIDSRRFNVGVTARLRFSPVTEGTVGVSQAVYDAEDAVQTYRTTRALDFGVTHKLTKNASLSVRIGQTTVETEELGTTAETTEGVSGRIGLNLGLPNGSFTADVSSSVNQDGTRLGLSLGRSFELANGKLKTSIGLTRPEGGDTGVTASLGYSQDLARGSFTLQLSRAVLTESDDIEKLTTALSLGYSQQLGALSRFGLNVSYSSSDATGADNRIDQTSFGATFSRELTPAWSLDAGYRYRMRDEETLATAESQSVFLTLNRVFNLRP